MNLKRSILLLAGLLAMTLTPQAQEFSGGFRAGLNFARFDGPSEMDGNGNEVEEFRQVTGFHIGATFNYAITDLFGLRGELVYSQRGVDYNFEGDSYWIFHTTAGQRVFSTAGQRRTLLDITQSYIDLPLMAYGRVGRFEFSGGVIPSFLISSRGSGEITYSGTTVGGSVVEPFTAALDFNFFRDNFEEDPTDIRTRNLDGQIVIVPRVLGANFNDLDEDEDVFAFFDLSLTAGLSFFLNEGLYIGGRFNYGLLDVTREERDVSRVSLDENRDYIFRDDFDRNISIQASIGFLF